MADTLTIESAKRAALALVDGIRFGDWTKDGLHMYPHASAAFRAVGLGLDHIAEPLPGSKRSPSNEPLDLYAPSAWHALCAVLYQDTRARLLRGSFAAAVQDAHDRLGGRPFYRGQSRAWDIQPSAWRSEAYAASSQTLIPRFRDALSTHLHSAPDPVMALVGRPDIGDAAAGLAQHYGLPTNLTDWSFSPLVAVCFACGDSTSQPVMPRDLRVARLQDCAVVYVIAAPALSTIAKPTFDFPPAYSKRLYLQKGLFADFGPYPGETSVKEGLEDYKAPWSWLQQNCQRIFFPRTYPAVEGADELRNNHLMEGDAFLQELAKSIASGASGDPVALEHRPPWTFDADDAEAHGNASSEMAFRIDAYLRRAALVKFEEDGDLLDPLLVGLLLRDVAPELDAIGRLADMTGQPGLQWIQERLTRARSPLDAINRGRS